MFESAELGHKISKTKYKEMLPTLRADLLSAQIELFKHGEFPVIILISGQDGAGKGETINVLYEWMDARYISTMAFAPPSDEEQERPTMWRYWRALPPKGRIGIFSGSWYSEPIAQRLAGKLSKSEFEVNIDRINRFEQMLINEGALVLKFWFHLSFEGQKQRLKELERNPKTAWRVNKWHWDRLKTYDKLQKVSGHVLRMTNKSKSPWRIVEGTDDRYRYITVGQTILSAINDKLTAIKNGNQQKSASNITKQNTINSRSILSQIDLTLSLSENHYKKQLTLWQRKLAELARDPRLKTRSIICAFEGADAAGKGGAIRRISTALDARQFQIIPVAAPTEEERAQPYLWRFWRHIPRHGRFVIFDRTWYGRVLVERVENFCQEADWSRAYGEINDFEHELLEAGSIVIKFWLQVSQDEQLRRFKQREEIAFKRFKITAEDWRNRKKWNDYQQAVCDMIDRTSTGEAPWTIIEANDKNFARIKILRTLCMKIESELDNAIK